MDAVPQSVYVIRVILSFVVVSNLIGCMCKCESVCVGMLKCVVYACVEFIQKFRLLGVCNKLNRC